MKPPKNHEKCQCSAIASCTLKILSFLLTTTLIANTNAIAQEVNIAQTDEEPNGIAVGSNIFEFSTQSVLNSAEAGALGLLIKFAEPVSNLRRQRAFGNDNNVGVIDVMPELHIATGDNGTFQSILAKVTGGVYVADYGDLVGSQEPKPPVFHNFPISLGLETTRHFDSFAVLGEVGWVPFADIKEVEGSTGENYVWGINPRFGLYLQGGYKFDAGGHSGTGASADRSSEAENDYLLRAKASLDFEFNDLANWDLGSVELGVSAFGHARGWYDIANYDWYHSVGATLRFNADDQQDKYFDISVKNGSGEPNFAPGTQFSAGLTVSY